MDKRVRLKVGDISPQGKLVIAWNKDAARHKKYKLRCIKCGYETDTSIKSFHNTCKSCSTVRTNLITPEHHLYYKYKHHANTVGVPFDISVEKFSVLVHMDCFYCGISPAQELVLPRKVDNYLLYNGVDRKICALGYTDENCVACCWPCNQAKRDWPIDQFEKMVRAWSERVDQWTIKT